MLGISRAGALFIDPYNLKEVSLTNLCLAVAIDFLAMKDWESVYYFEPWRRLVDGQQL